jgi:enoyl-CoA hydratase/carnithine racemase
MPQPDVPAGDSHALAKDLGLPGRTAAAGHTRGFLRKQTGAAVGGSGVPRRALASIGCRRPRCTRAKVASRRFLLTAEDFGAAEALRIGLAQEVVPAESHIQRARELAQLIAQQAPLGVQSTLANARVGRSQGPDAACEHLSSLLPGILGSQDAAEGLRSFTERRQARFTGR